MPYDAFISYCSEDKKVAEAVWAELARRISRQISRRQRDGHVNDGST